MQYRPSMTEPIRSIFPEFVPLNELARYGEDHDDMWVRRMGEIVMDVHVAIEESDYTQISDLHELIKEYREDLYSCKQDIDSESEERIAAEQKRQQAENKVDSLRYELDRDEQNRYITYLRAEITRKNDEIREHKRETTNLQSVIHSRNTDIVQLQNQLKHLEDKFQTWTILAT